MPWSFRKIQHHGLLGNWIEGINRATPTATAVKVNAEIAQWFLDVTKRDFDGTSAPSPPRNETTSMIWSRTAYSFSPRTISLKMRPSLTANGIRGEARMNSSDHSNGCTVTIEVLKAFEERERSWVKSRLACLPDLSEGLVTIARAAATRWRWPPDISELYRAPQKSGAAYNVFNAPKLPARTLRCRDAIFSREQ